MKRIATAVAIIALALSLALSITAWHHSGAGARRLFIFERYLAGAPAAGKKLAMEVRYIKKDSAQGDVKAYVDDLLLGNITHGLCPLFAPGTRAASCFVRAGVLYVDLTDDVLKAGGNTSDIQAGIALLKRNVRLNFGDIKDVAVFVGGVEAYRSNFYAKKA